MVGLGPTYEGDGHDRCRRRELISASMPRLWSPLRASRLVVVVSCLITLLAGCQGQTQQSETETALGDGTITIGSFAFPESELLAEIYALALEDEGFTVERVFGVGPRELLQPALAEGL